MIYTIEFDSAGKAFCASAYDTAPEALANNEFECTEDQYQNYASYALVDGAIVAASDATLLAAAQATQITALSAACSAAIVSGFQSSALGDPHTYPSAANDQTNLIGAVASGIATKFYCADSTGVWTYPDHTADQIKQVLVDASTQRQAYSVTLAMLSAQVQAATTVAAVQAIVWA